VQEILNVILVCDSKRLSATLTGLESIDKQLKPTAERHDCGHRISIQDGGSHESLDSPHQRYINTSGLRGVPTR
jgi:hypothetical protein